MHVMEADSESTDADLQFYDAQSYSQPCDLHKMCREGDMMEIYKLPGFIPDINDRDEHGMTALGVALKHQNYNCAVEMMSHGAILDEEYLEMAQQGFLRSIQSGSTHDVAAYLRAGLDPNKLVDSQRSFMSVAFDVSVRLQSTEMLSVMICHGGDVNTFLPDGRSLMATAMSLKEWRLVDLLIKHGANIGTRAGHQNQTIFHLLSVTSGTLHVMKSILSRIVKISQPILDYQCYWSNAFFQDMPYLEVEDSTGETALLHACEAGQTENIEVLLRFGANPDTPDRWNLTPLLATLFRRTTGINISFRYENKIKILKILLKHNANANLEGCVKLGEHGPYEVMSPMVLAVRTGQLLAAKIIHHVGGTNLYNIPDTAITWMDSCGQVFEYQKLEVVSWLRSARRSPIRLMSCCRQLIRGRMGRPFVANLEALNLPVLLKSYLALNDLDDFDQENGEFW